jgi:hypothetical protein
MRVCGGSSLLKLLFGLGLSLSSALLYANSITLYVIPPSGRLSWDSPRAIATTALASLLQSGYHPIGHVTARVECAYKGQNVAFWTGMTSSRDNPSDSDLLLKKKIGMGVFYYSFNGLLETEPRIRADLARAQNMIGRLFTLKFLINSDHCERIDRYFSEYQRQGVGRVYGLVHRPRHREGAGCTAHAATFLEVAGVMSPAMKSHLSRTVRVPSSLIGDSRRAVPFSHVLGSATSRRWALANEPHRELFFYDTQFFYDWARALQKQGVPGQVWKDEEAHRIWHRYIRVRRPGNGRRPGGTTVRKSNGFFGLVIDRRHVPAARDPIWRRD